MAWCCDDAVTTSWQNCDKIHDKAKIAYAWPDVTMLWQNCDNIHDKASIPDTRHYVVMMLWQFHDRIVITFMIKLRFLTCSMQMWMQQNWESIYTHCGANENSNANANANTNAAHESVRIVIGANVNANTRALTTRHNSGTNKTTIVHIRILITRATYNVYSGVRNLSYAMFSIVVMIW